MILLYIYVLNISFIGTIDTVFSTSLSKFSSHHQFLVLGNIHAVLFCLRERKISFNTFDVARYMVYHLSTFIVQHPCLPLTKNNHGANITIVYDE